MNWLAVDSWYIGIGCCLDWGIGRTDYVLGVVGLDWISIPLYCSESWLRPTVFSIIVGVQDKSYAILQLCSSGKVHIP